MPITRIFDSRKGRSFIENEAVLRLSDTKLRGLHNIENLMATLAVGMARGLSFRADGAAALRL